MADHPAGLGGYDAEREFERVLQLQHRLLSDDAALEQLVSSLERLLEAEHPGAKAWFAALQESPNWPRYAPLFARFLER